MLRGQGALEGPQAVAELSQETLHEEEGSPVMEPEETGESTTIPEVEDSERNGAKGIPSETESDEDVWGGVPLCVGHT